jgi:hypothetical protein
MGSSFPFPRPLSRSYKTLPFLTVANLPPHKTPTKPALLTEERPFSVPLVDLDREPTIIPLKPRISKKAKRSKTTLKWIHHNQENPGSISRLGCPRHRCASRHFRILFVQCRTWDRLERYQTCRRPRNLRRVVTDSYPADRHRGFTLSG